MKKSSKIISILLSVTVVISYLPYVSFTGEANATTDTMSSIIQYLRDGNVSQVRYYNQYLPEIEDEEDCVKNMSSGMKDAYRKEIEKWVDKKESGDTGSYMFYDYWLTDMDDDGSAELLLALWPSHAGALTYAYKYDNGKLKNLGIIGGMELCHAYPNHNGVVLEYGYMGYNSFTLVTVQDGKIKTDTLNTFEFEDGEDYIHLGNQLKSHNKWSNGRYIPIYDVLEEPGELCPVTWQWGKSNYSFKNNFGRGSSYYIRDDDLAAFLKNLSNTEIARCADMFGSGNVLTPHKTKLYNFLTNHLKNWGGSCFGMSLTAAMFQNSELRTLDLFGVENTHDLSINNNRLESIINYYHMIQASDSYLDTVELSTFDPIARPEFIKNLYCKAKAVNTGDEDIFLLVMYADGNNDGDYDDPDDYGHAVICYGAVDKEITISGKFYNRALLIADPNKTEETYLYISSDYTAASYSEDTRYGIFGYCHCSLSDLNRNDYARSYSRIHDEMYYQLLTTGKKIVVLGDNGKKGRIILDSKGIVLDESSGEWFIDVIREMGTGGDLLDTRAVYRLAGNAQNYTIMPYEDSDLDVSLYDDDYCASVSGAMKSFEMTSSKSIKVEDGSGELSVDMTANDNLFSFVNITGTANGDAEFSLNNDDKILILGDMSDCTVTNMDAEGNKSETLIEGGYDAEVSINDNHEMKVQPYTDDRANQVGIDGTSLGEGASAEAAEAAIIEMKNDNDLPGSVFNKLQLKSSKQTNTSVSLTWRKVAGASSYVIYGNRCGKTNKMQRLAVSTGKSKKFTKILGKKLKKGAYYKFMVIALDSDNNVVSSSKIIHVATKGGKVGNAGKVTTKAKKNKVSIKKGKTFKLKAKQVAANKKLKVKKHRVLSYESTNPKVATVTKKGVIKGKKKGTCYVYAYAQNGVFAKIKVTVK